MLSFRFISLGTVMFAAVLTLDFSCTAGGVTIESLAAAPAVVDRSTSQLSLKQLEPIEVQPLGSILVGQQIAKVMAEFESLAEIVPGTKVDVLLATLSSDGTKTMSVLKNAVVHSIEDISGVNASGAAGMSPAESSVLPVREVELVVSDSQVTNLRLAEAQGILRVRISNSSGSEGLVSQVLANFAKNLFQPLLLFFFMGFAIPLLRVPFEFPKALYQSLTLYLLVSIGWHGGELMAEHSADELAIAGGLAIVGFVTNAVFGLASAYFLKWFTPMRQIDAITVGSYYGSDSAGTFVTCLGILTTLNILHDSFMPVLLAVMEIPGCLVGLYLISRLRSSGMDAMGNMPGETGYQPTLAKQSDGIASQEPCRMTPDFQSTVQPGQRLCSIAVPEKRSSALNLKVLHEVFLNPGLYLLFGGIVVGFLSGMQAHSDPQIIEGPDHLFVFIFKGALCLFLLEMGMTACQRLRDVRSAGMVFVAFGLLAPLVFAVCGMLVLHGYSTLLGHPFQVGTYVLFSVLCAAASYIAVPAVQRIAIPEASPTLPLAASLGLTFTWNVTLGIPIYLEIAKAITNAFPVC